MSRAHDQRPDGITLRCAVELHHACPRCACSCHDPQPSLLCDHVYRSASGVAWCARCGIDLEVAR
jgi:hypothetical protein